MSTEGIALSWAAIGTVSAILTAVGAVLLRYIQISFRNEFDELFDRRLEQYVPKDVLTERFQRFDDRLLRLDARLEQLTQAINRTQSPKAFDRLSRVVPALEALERTIAKRLEDLERRYTG